MELKIAGSSSLPVWRESHGKDGSHIQVSRLVNDAFGNHSAALIDDREEDEFDDVLGVHGRGLLALLLETCGL